jgi:hypothetical protein
MSLNVCIVRLVTMVILLLAVTRCVPSAFLVMNVVVASCWLSSGDVESSVSVTSTRAHTP